MINGVACRRSDVLLNVTCRSVCLLAIRRSRTNSRIAVHWIKSHGQLPFIVFMGQLNFPTSWFGLSYTIAAVSICYTDIFRFQTFPMFSSAITIVVYIVIVEWERATRSPEKMRKWRSRNRDESRRENEKARSEKMKAQRRESLMQLMHGVCILHKLTGTGYSWTTL